MWVFVCLCCLVGGCAGVRIGQVEGVNRLWVGWLVGWLWVRVCGCKEHACMPAQPPSTKRHIRHKPRHQPRHTYTYTLPLSHIFKIYTQPHPPFPHTCFHLIQLLGLPDKVVLRQLDVRDEAAPVREGDIVLSRAHLEGEGPHLLHHGRPPCFGVIWFSGLCVGVGVCVCVGGGGCWVHGLVLYFVGGPPCCSVLSFGRSVVGG